MYRDAPTALSCRAGWSARDRPSCVSVSRMMAAVRSVILRQRLAIAQHRPEQPPQRQVTLAQTRCARSRQFAKSLGLLHVSKAEPAKLTSDLIAKGCPRKHRPFRFATDVVLKWSVRLAKLLGNLELRQFSNHSEGSVARTFDAPLPN